MGETQYQAEEKGRECIYKVGHYRWNRIRCRDDCRAVDLHVPGFGIGGEKGEERRD